MRKSLLALILAAFLPICHFVFAQESAKQQLDQGIALAQESQHETALNHFDRALGQDPKLAEAYYFRGRSRFCLAQVKEAVADFDRYVELAPKAESQQWERGIAFYYAGEYERGAKQFELYQTYHDNDVENSAWRYLCVAKDKGVKEASKTLLPIRNDARVPMMEIYDLYAGKLKPEEVLAAVEKHTVAGGKSAAPRFYAHLYIGLWHEAAGRADLAAKHVQEAERHKIGHYMWDVARVHNELRKKK